MRVAFPRRPSLVLDDLAALHHERDVLHHPNVLERIARNRDDIGVLAGLHRPRALRHAKQRSRVHRGGLDRSQRGKAAAHQRAKLLRGEIGILVRAVDDSEMVLESEVEGWLLSLENRLALRYRNRIGAERTAHFHAVLERVEGRIEPRPTLFHQRGSFFVHDRAVLYGIDAGPNGRFDALRAFGMRHHALPGPVRHFHGARHLRLAQLLHVEIAQRVHHASGSHQLDPVGAILQVVPDGFTDLVHRIRQVRAPRQRLVGRQHVGIAMAAGDADEVARRNDPRPANESLLDGVAQRQLTV